MIHINNTVDWTPDYWVGSSDSNIQEEPVSSKLLKVYVQDLPSYAHENIEKEIVQNALKDWTQLNPNLEFKIISENYDVGIDWTKEIRGHENAKGIASSSITTNDYGNIINEEHYILIDLIDYDCNGNEIFWNEDSIKDTIKHEIGHVLGFDHSSNKDHLMYNHGDDVFNISSLNYRVPTPEYEIPSSTNNDYYLGQKELEMELNRLDKLLDMGYTDHLVDKYNEVVSLSNCYLDSQN